MATSKRRNRDVSHNNVGTCARIRTCKKPWCGKKKCAKNKCCDYKDPLNRKYRK